MEILIKTIEKKTSDKGVMYLVETHNNGSMSLWRNSEADDAIAKELYDAMRDGVIIPVQTKVAGKYTNIRGLGAEATPATNQTQVQAPSPGVEKRMQQYEDKELAAEPIIVAKSSVKLKRTTRGMTWDVKVVEGFDLKELTEIKDAAIAMDDALHKVYPSAV